MKQWWNELPKFVQYGMYVFGLIVIIVILSVIF